MEDSSYIERGMLLLDPDKTYAHSWIVFQYENEEFVFDPCLNILVKKVFYTTIFETDIFARITAEEVKAAFNYEYANYTSLPDISDCTEVMASVIEFFKKNMTKEQLQEICIYGDDDNIASPFYKNGSGYNPVFKNGKLVELKAHFYF